MVAYVSHRLTSSTENDSRQRRARYLATRVVCILDPFSSRCADIVHDDGLTDHEGISHPRETVPELHFPDDVDWQSIDVTLMYNILSLPNEIDSANASVTFVGDEVASPPDFEEYFDERQYQYARLGLLSLELSDQLRKRYRLPPRDTEAWSPRGLFEKTLKKRKDAEEEVIPSPALPATPPE